MSELHQILYIDIHENLLQEPDSQRATCSLNSESMSKPATQRKRIAPAPSPQPMPIWSCDKEATAQISSFRLLEMPLGAIHLDQAWQILEYRRDKDAALLSEATQGKHLFAVAPWIKNSSFVKSLNHAIRSGVSNFHFDFKVSVKTAERTIHVNTFTLGDMTAWLFISDKTLPSL